MSLDGRIKQITTTSLVTLADGECQFQSLIILTDDGRLYEKI